jgi:predicted naringenin-chalcone synthase
MAVFLHHIETVVPGTPYSQAHVLELMQMHHRDDRKTTRLLAGIYRHSGIEQRYSVLPEFVPGAPEGVFYDAAEQRFRFPGTGVRNDLYTENARRLYPCLARRVLERTPEIRKEDVTHVITVSCTGFFAPGPEFHIVKELGLSPATQRYHLGFMGCYAAVPALRMAKSFCEADPAAVVLVVSVELCTLHLQSGTDPDNLIANSVFADGGAAALVSSRSPASESVLELDAFATTLVPSGERDMAWAIGDSGFQMVLSTYVPEILRANITDATEPVLREAGRSKDEVRHWAVHPGGRAILDQVEAGLALPEDSLSASRKVLREYGNMSSASILFVLKTIMDTPREAAGEVVHAVAFGPGLTVESALLHKIG